ncbi:MAG: alpha/beta fold hydrolase [Acidimicrobiales bacterium]
MSGPNRGRRTAGLAALGAGAALAAGWAAQRRLVSRSSATEEDIAREELVFPADVEHQDIEMDDGGRIHVVSRGRGQPIVLLHGVFLNSGIWVHQLSDLSDELRVIAVDLRGHGRSVLGSDGFGLKVPGTSTGRDRGPETVRDTGHRFIEDPVGDLLDPAIVGHAGSNGLAGMPAQSSAAGSGGYSGHQGYSGVSLEPVKPSRRRTRVRLLGPRRNAPPALDRLALDVRQVLASLDVEGGVLVGHSMGGMVAVQAIARMSAEERHRRLSGLVLTSTTTGPFVELPGWDLFAALSAPAALRAIRASVRSGRGAIPEGDVRWWASRLGFGAEAPPAQVKFLEAMLAETDPLTMEGLLEPLARVNLASVLDSVDIPALVMVGTHDRLTPPWHARRLESRLPDARLVELARCGHMPMLERRREFDRLLEEHARKVS